MVRWEDVREDLLDAMLQVSMPLTRDQQESIVAILNERGHNVTWNAMSHVLSERKDNFVMAAKAKTWDVEANEALLRVMNNHYHPNAADCKAMIGQLNAKGYAFSDSALLQHLQKLRRKEVGGGGGSNGEGSSTPKTLGGKKKAATPAKTASTGKKRKNGKQADFASILANSGDDEDDDDYDTPSKKKIKQAIIKNNAVKNEVVEVQDDEESFEPQPFVKEEARDLEWENRDMV